MTFVVVGVVLATEATCVHRFLVALPGSTITNTSEVSAWLVDYRNGFVRRGLPGQVLSWIVGGSPSSGAVDVAAVVLLVYVITACTWLVWAASRPVVGLPAWTVRALVLASPFTIATTVKDVGRYDGFGVIALVVIATAPSVRAAVLLPVVAFSAAAAVASEELLVLFVGPCAAAAAWRACRGRAAVVAVVVPAMIVAVVSSVVRPTRRQLYAMADAAHAARADITRESSATAIAALNQTAEQVERNLSVLAWWTVPVATLGFAMIYGTTVAAIRWIVGRPGGRASVVAAIWFAVAATSLSVIGIDYRRWWALAFVAAVSTMIAMFPAGGELPSRPSLSPTVVSAVLAVSLVGQFAPMTAGTIDPAAGRIPKDAIATAPPT